MRTLAIALALVATACSSTEAQTKAPPAPADPAPAGLEVATFAGGCFWCMESEFDKLPGVVSAVSGYTDGHVVNPAYKDVGKGKTGHTEALKVTFDPKKVTFEALLERFWHNIDPTDMDGQFCDRGPMYRPTLFYHSEAQKKAAEASLVTAQKALKTGQINTPIKAATKFYDAEAYHQDFWKKNPGHYQRYRAGCGRDARLKALWGASGGR